MSRAHTRLALTAVLAAGVAGAALVPATAVQTAGECPGVPRATVTPEKTPTDRSDARGGTPDQDLLALRNGPDVAIGRKGADCILGGGGTDTLDGGAGDDVIEGGADGDVVRGGTGEDILKGGSGNDALYGGADADSINGDEDDDVIVDGPWHGMLDGGLENDTITTAVGGKFVFQGALAAAASDSIKKPGYTTTRRIDGGPGDDQINAANGVAEGVSCGDGNDSAFLDSRDYAATDCELRVYSIKKPG
jgi:Ca2+-binding RTX toxin-like protein